MPKVKRAKPTRSSMESVVNGGPTSSKRMAKAATTTARPRWNRSAGLNSDAATDGRWCWRSWENLREIFFRQQNTINELHDQLRETKRNSEGRNNRWKRQQAKHRISRLRWQRNRSMYISNYAYSGAALAFNNHANSISSFLGPERFLLLER